MYPVRIKTGPSFLKSPQERPNRRPYPNTPKTNMSFPLASSPPTPFLPSPTPTPHPITIKRASKILALNQQSMRHIPHRAKHRYEAITSHHHPFNPRKFFHRFLQNGGMAMAIHLISLLLTKPIHTTVFTPACTRVPRSAFVPHWKKNRQAYAVSK